MAELFKEFQLNKELKLNNRIVMAPLTRCFANDALEPTEEVAAYYALRADAGLIISEATIVDPTGQGYPNTPGIFTQGQIQAWKRVTAAVHKRGGKIFCQLWHVGRVSHPVYQKEYQLPVAPSAVALQGRISRSEGLEYGTPRALETEEVKQLVTAYGQAAENSLDAGFDGVEIHAANGYLIDQFLHKHTNCRNDEYGGSTENRQRFAQEVIESVCEKIPSHRVGIRLSPGAYYYQEHTSGDEKTYQQLLKFIESKKLAYVHTGIFDDNMIFDYLGGTATQFLRKHYRGHLIACGGYDLERAEVGLKNKYFDLIAFGRPFIANPDFVQCLKQGEPLSPYNESMLSSLV